MTVKEYLNQIRYLDLKIKQREEEREQLLAAATSTGCMDPDKVHVQTSAGSSKSDLVNRAVDLEHKINSMIRNMNDLRHKIIGQIQELPDRQQVDCLYQRYVLGYTWELIAVNMGYNVRQVYRIHGHALQAFRKKYFDKMS